jgi:hypothetical protein
MGLSMKSILLVMTNPVEGREDEYNEWYDEVHLAEVVALDGFAGARRYKLSPVQREGVEPTHAYLAIYELDCEAAEAFAALDEAVGGGRMVVPPVLDATTTLLAYDVIGDREEED